MNPLAACPNPFKISVVTDPWDPSPTDVTEIHAEAYELCRRALEHVRESQHSTGVLLHGAAGSGKTHLLARLHGRLLDNAGPGGEVVFVSVPMRTTPQMLWRHTRRRLVDDLVRPSPAGVQLERVLVQRLGGIERIDGDRQLWWEYLRDDSIPEQLEARLEDLFDRLDQEAEIGRDVSVVLTHLLLGRHRRDARAWLRGDSLPENVLNTLGVVRTEEIADEQEDRARRCVLALCRLMGPEAPLVLCFDQIESLQTSPTDKNGLFEFGKFFGTLHAQTKNALLISCIQSAFLDLFTDAIRESDRQRIAEFGRLAFKPLTLPSASRLVQARLNDVPDVARLRALQSNPLWPLKEADIRSVVAPRGAVARKVLAHCAELFETARGKTHPPMNAGDYLEQEWQLRVEESLAASAPEQTGPLLEHGLPLLVDLASEGWKNTEREGEIDMIFSGPDGRVGVALCNQPNMKSLAGKLRRLEDRLDELKLEKVVLFRDPRLPISKTAKATREYLEKLSQRDTTLVHPSVEALAALEALRGLLSDAKSGDLANSGDTIEMATVRSWLASRLPESLQTLLEFITSPPRFADNSPGQSAVFEDLLELVEARRVVRLDEAAAELGHPLEVLSACVARHPAQFGFLSGPPAVVFDYVPESVNG